MTQTISSFLLRVNTYFVSLRVECMPQSDYIRMEKLLHDL